MGKGGVFRLLALLLFLLAIPAPAQSLEHLEAIVGRYPTLNGFLGDPQGLNEYRDAYREFLGDRDNDSEDGFDAVWKKFISQLRAVAKKFPEFGAQVWRLNPNWRETEFGLEGDAKGSGLQANREALLGVMQKASEEADQGARKIKKSDVKRVVEALRKKFQVLTRGEVEKLSRSAAKAYSIRIGGDRKNNRPGLAADPLAKSLTAFLTAALLKSNESLRDYLHSGDADMTYHGVRRLERLEDFAGFFEGQGLSEVGELLPYLKISSKHLDGLVSDYQRGRESMQAFRQIKDASPSPELLSRLLSLAAEGIRGEKVREKLSAALKKHYDVWEAAADEVREKKKKQVRNFRSPYFKYSAVEDPDRKTLRLQSDGPLALTYVASPRPFHLLLAGRKNNECVGGGICDDLVVKRWARAGLAGDRSLFSLKPDRKMEGFIGLTEVSKAKDRERSWIVDLGSRATKGQVLLRNEAGSPVRYTFFDSLIDHLSESNLSPPGRLLVSDGDTVSGNVAGSELRERSQAYNEKREVGVPGDFFPKDPLAAKIARAFPATAHEYGGGGFIFDGMINDGATVYQLVPRKERRRWTKSELEFELYSLGLEQREVPESLWISAFESGVRLEAEKVYRRDASIRKFFHDYVADFKVRFPDGAAATELEAALENFSRVLKSNRVLLSNPMDDVDLRDNLSKNAIRYAGTSVAGKILSLGNLDARSYGEFQIEALSKNLEISIPDPIRVQAARTLAWLAQYYPLSRLLEPDVLDPITKTLMAPASANPEESMPAHYAAEFLKNAIEQQPRNELLIAKPVLSAVARAITSAAAMKTERQRQQIIGPLSNYLFTAVRSHPKLESLVSNEIISSLEKALNLTDFYQGMYRYVDIALDNHPRNERLLSSPLLAVVDQSRLVDALMKLPKETRFDHPAVWDRLLKHFPVDREDVTKLLLALLKKNPNSGVFKYDGFAQALEGNRDPAVKRLLAHFKKKAPKKRNCKGRLEDL